MWKPIREFEVIQKSMKNLKQDIEEINQTISNNRGEIKRPDMTLSESGSRYEALSDKNLGTKS